ncbi:MAG: YceI family protein [Saprospiraceae bacterium]|nr:YceI family protein [Saprospiraceae bacterium]
MVFKQLRWHKIYPFCTLAVFIFFSFSIVIEEWSSEYKKIEYAIQSSSVLEVNGKTNINSFCCSSNEQFKTKSLIYRAEQDYSYFNFQDTKFAIQIKDLDCGKKKINRDLFKALEVDKYPTISIQLKEAINTECADMTTCGEWFDFEVNTDITITCETRTIQIPIRVKRLDDTSYRIQGGTGLKLCDFEVKAPSALLGLIKVKDEIEFNFDLYVELRVE